MSDLIKKVIDALRNAPSLDENGYICTKAEAIKAVESSLSNLDAAAPAAGGDDQWPDPKVTNPDIANPTGDPYIDCLLHRLLDAQQDINFHANSDMNQSLADAAALIDEVETAIRKLAAPPLQAPSHSDAVREAFFRELGEPTQKLPRWSQGAEPFELWSREVIEAALSALAPASKAPAVSEADVGRIIEAAKPKTGKDVLTNAYERGRFDGVTEYARNLLRLTQSAAQGGGTEGGEA